MLNEDAYCRNKLNSLIACSNVNARIALIVDPALFFLLNNAGKICFSDFEAMSRETPPTIIKYVLMQRPDAANTRGGGGHTYPTYQNL